MMQTILTDHFGLRLDKAALTADVTDIKRLLRMYGFILVSNIVFDKAAYDAFVRRFGMTVGHQRVETIASQSASYAGIAEIGDEPDRVVSGRGQLPLHADGGIDTHRVDHIFLFAANVAGFVSGGNTRLCNHRAAFTALPIHLLSILQQQTFEFRIIEPGTDRPDADQPWRVWPIFKDLCWVRKVHLYFPFDPGEPASWEVRIVGFDQDVSDAFFSELAAFLRRERYAYTHCWKQGDLLICDNRTLLHERLPFRRGDGRRVLWRGLTREDDDA